MTAPSLPVSVIAPVYRHTAYLEPAIRSILALEYEPLQIVIVDDASPDDAFDVLQRLVDDYSGPHTILLDRNRTNLSMGTYNVLMERATADHIVVAHDDDIQYPFRVRRVMETYAAHDVSMVTCNAMNIYSDEQESRLMTQEGATRRIPLVEVARTGRPDAVQGAAMSWRRDVFDRFGPVDVNGTARTSDYILPFRAALLDGIVFLDEPLLDRRVHFGSRGKIGWKRGDKDVTQVELASERITQLAYMLETLDAFAERHPARSDELAEVRSNLLLRLEELARTLGIHRNRLHMRKMRMDWIGHDISLPEPGEAEQPETTSGTSDMMLAAPIRAVGNWLKGRATKSSDPD